MLHHGVFSACYGIYRDYGQQKPIITPIGRNPGLFGQPVCTIGHISGCQKFLLLGSNGSSEGVLRGYIPSYPTLPGALQLTLGSVECSCFYLFSYTLLHRNIHCNPRRYKFPPAGHIGSPLLLFGMRTEIFCCLDI